MGRPPRGEVYAATSFARGGHIPAQRGVATRRAAPAGCDARHPERGVRGPVLPQDTLEKQATVVFLKSARQCGGLARDRGLGHHLPPLADREQGRAVFPDPGVEPRGRARGSERAAGQSDRSIKAQAVRVQEAGAALDVGHAEH